MNSHKLKLFNFESSFPEAYPINIREFYTNISDVTPGSNLIANFNSYLNSIESVLKNNSDDILDDRGNIKFAPQLSDAAKEDTQTILIQQNSMYIVGMITTATILITAVMLSR